MSERSKETVLKTVEVQASASSNLAHSANKALIINMIVGALFVNSEAKAHKKQWICTFGLKAAGCWRKKLLQKLLQQLSNTAELFWSGCAVRLEIID